MVDAPYEWEKVKNRHDTEDVMHTTSFGGTSPEVFRENVVRSETECIVEMHCVRRTRVGRGGGGAGGLREGEPIRRLDCFGFDRNWCLFSVGGAYFR